MGTNCLFYGTRPRRAEQNCPCLAHNGSNTLSRVHAAPYRLRYPLGFHVIVLPNQPVMFEGLEQLVATVNACVK